MEYKKNKKKFSLAFKEVALKAVSKNESWKKANLPMYGMLKRENGQKLLVKLVTKL